MTKKQGGGFSPWREHFTQGSDSTAILKEVGFVAEFTYGGRHKDRPACALRTVYEIDGMDREWEDHWPIGPSEGFEVSDDGYTVTALGGRSGLNERSAGAFFFDALQTAIEKGKLELTDYVEVDEDENTICVKALEEIRVRLVNKSFENISGDSKDKKVIGAILADDEKPAKKSSSKSDGKSSGKAVNKAAKSSSSDEIEEKTVEAVRALFENESRIKKGDLPNAIYQANKKDPDAKAMMQCAFKETFLVSEQGWTYDKKRGVLLLAEVAE